MFHAKWTVLVQLQGGPHRFNAIWQAMPPSVEYRLTPLGESLMQHSVQLVDWATLKQGEIANARARFDAA